MKLKKILTPGIGYPLVKCWLYSIRKYCSRNSIVRKFGIFIRSGLGSSIPILSSSASYHQPAGLIMITARFGHDQNKLILEISGFPANFSQRNVSKVTVSHFFHSDLPVFSFL